MEFSTTDCAVATRLVCFYIGFGKIHSFFFFFISNSDQKRTIFVFSEIVSWLYNDVDLPTKVKKHYDRLENVYF